MKTHLVGLGGLGYEASPVVVHQQPGCGGAPLGLHAQGQGDGPPLAAAHGQQLLTVLWRDRDRNGDRETDRNTDFENIFIGSQNCQRSTCCGVMSIDLTKRERKRERD